MRGRLDATEGNASEATGVSSRGLCFPCGTCGNESTTLRSLIDTSVEERQRAWWGLELRREVRAREAKLSGSA